MTYAEVRRSPYLVLGVPFSASPAEARKAFVRKSRRVKGASDSPYSMEDLAWALHAIEAAEDDPHSSIEYYRVPANPAALESEQEPEPKGLFAPEPVPFPRQTEHEPGALEALADKELDKFVRHVATYPLDAPYGENRHPEEVS